MLPPHWFGAEDARAAYARTLDAVNALDAWTSAKQFETSLLSANARTLLEQQRTFEDFASQHRASVIDLGADAALARLTLASVSADLLSNARLHAAELHWHLAEATRAVDYASKWGDIQRAISVSGAGLPPGMTFDG